ncbi:hypothetical protein GCM10010219_30140 [Streptomyces netropsis]|nr:hypothetical protein GCM10010219_30140 [Streptomyces netropsis]
MQRLVPGCPSVLGDGEGIASVAQDPTMPVNGLGKIRVARPVPGDADEPDEPGRGGRGSSKLKAHSVLYVGGVV